MYLYRTTVPYYTTAVPTTKSVASLCGLKLVVWPKFGTDPARVPFGPLWLFKGPVLGRLYFLKVVQQGSTKLVIPVLWFRYPDFFFFYRGTLKRINSSTDLKADDGACDRAPLVHQNGLLCMGFRSCTLREVFRAHMHKKVLAVDHPAARTAHLQQSSRRSGSTVYFCSTFF